jgi:Na+-transporting methylmalonyl-CoA/oxaloacetate decarboxylase gamma subunit
VIVNPPSVTVNPSPVNVTSPGGGATYVTVEPSVTETPTVQSPDVNVTVEQPAATPTTIIDNPDTPLGDSDLPTSWSLLDLIATILAVLLLLVFAIKMFFDRPKDEQYQEEPVDANFLAAMTPEQRAQYQARREADYQAWVADQQKANNKQKSMFVNAPVLLVAGLAFVEALILLFTTQNFNAPMVLIDNWTVVFALILFVQLLTPMVAAVIHNSRKASKQEQLDAQVRANANVSGNGVVTY